MFVLGAWGLLAAPAGAWTTSGDAWAYEAMPLAFQWSGVPDGLDHDETLNAVEEAVEAWTGVECDGLSAEVAGVALALPDPEDRRLSITFGDPRCPRLK